MIKTSVRGSGYPKISTLSAKTIQQLRAKIAFLGVHGANQDDAGGMLEENPSRSTISSPAADPADHRPRDVQQLLLKYITDHGWRQPATNTQHQMPFPPF
jgi:hypothetical protein